MKFTSFINWVSNIITGDRKAEKLRLLRQQRLLLHRGLEATAEVMGASLFDEKVGNLIPVQLWVKLKKPDGSFLYTHTQSLVKASYVPCSGEQIRIKYFPGNLSAIVIL